MRLFLLISSLAFFRVAHVIGDENLFSDGIYEPLDEWTTGPDLGDAPEPLFGNLDGAQLTQDTNLELASLSINDELNTDLWASCPASGLGKRDGEHPSCNVPLRKEEVPTLPTLREVEKAVGNTPNSEPDTTPLRVNDVVPLYRADSKCPPTNPWHLCCICDDAFALEVCQDCLLCTSSRFLISSLVVQLPCGTETVCMTR